MSRRGIVRAAVLLSLAVTGILPAAAVDITITPSLPAEAQQGISTVLGWLYLVAWFAVFGAGVWGVFNLVRGDQDAGKKYLGGAIVGAIVLAALPSLINSLTGGVITINI